MPGTILNKTFRNLKKIRLLKELFARCSEFYILQCSAFPVFFPIFIIDF